MKISKRSAISQSLDLFIIIGAVLAVGGIVTTSVYGLVNANSQSTAMQVTSISAAGGTNGNLVDSFSMVVKDIGSASLTGTMTITLVGTVSGNLNATYPSPTVATTTGSTTTPWIVHVLKPNSVIILTSPDVSLAPGGQISVSVGSIPYQGTGETIWLPGAVQTVSVTLGVASTTATVTS
jgi:hypothetical protein